MSIEVRDLPLALARCCTLYVVSMQHLVPACRECGLTPSYEKDVTLDQLREAADIWN